MHKRIIASVLVSSLVFSGCGDKTDEAGAQVPLGPGVGVLELPVSLRASDPLPSDFRKIEIGLADIRADEKLILPLENGKVPAAERNADLLPKLQAALQSPARAGLALRMHASVSYETAALVLNTAKTAGMHKLAFEVRQPGGASTTTGWLSVNAFQTTPRTDDEVKFASVDPRKWDDFTALWEGMHNACRTAQSGSCAYVPTEPARGGSLKIVLHASGQGVNLDFFRVGLSPEELAAEEKARDAARAQAKEDVVQGRAAQKDLVAELTDGAPASEALFQFRATEAVQAPSALTQVMQPLCGPRACGAVVSADSNTLSVRVVSLIGAAFAEGSVAPALAFELPWTEKPKRAAPSAPAPAAAP